jgi:WD40 repeat protein
MTFVFIPMSPQVQKLHTITGHNDCVYALQPSSEESIFFSGAGDGMVVRWDLRDPDKGELIAKLPNSIYALYHDPVTNLLTAGHNYDGIHLLDWQNKKEVGSLQITKALIFDIRRVGNHILVACGDGSVVMIDPNDLAIKNRIEFSEKSARTIAVDPLSGDIAIGYSDNYIRIFDRDLHLKSQWKAHSNSVFTMRYMEGSQLISGSRDARLKVWDGKSSYAQAEEVVAHMYAINHIEFSPDNKHFVTCSMDKSIKVWETDTLTLLKVIDRSRHAGHGTSVNRLLWTTYKNQLLSASDDRTISVWHIIF